MSKISYPQLVKDIADAYRTASGTVEKVKYGELASKVEEMSTVKPQGTLDITENGEFDVKDYATAVVDVPPQSISIDSELIIASWSPNLVANLQSDVGNIGEITSELNITQEANL